MPSPHGLADRIRRARNDLGLRQRELADQTGVDLRTVQGWEAGRRPRGAAASKLERVLGIDLSAEPETTTSPRLDEATDAQVIANLAARLADRDHTIRELRDQLDNSPSTPTASVTAMTAGRWAARKREAPDRGDQPGRSSD